MTAPMHTMRPRQAAPTRQAAVELRAVSREYGTKQAKVRALDEVSVAFPAGSWTAVMGPSGSGKSTLLHCAAGLEQVSGGQVLLDGTDITGASDDDLTDLRRGRIGFVFQSFNLIGSLTAEQNVALPLKLAGKRVSTKDVRGVLESVGLADRMRHRPRELSGGQQQRVAIARAMVTRPAVLFADEPTGALDSSSARTVLALLREMVTAGGQSIVMVTHDPAAAASADSVVFLSDGRIVDHAVAPSAREVADRLARLEAGSGPAPSRGSQGDHRARPWPEAPLSGQRGASGGAGALGRDVRPVGTIADARGAAEGKA